MSSGQFAIEYAEQTDVGVKRSHNQDSCSTHPANDEAKWHAHGHLFIIADGMGGHAVGEKASAIAVREIPLSYLKHVSTGVESALRNAIEEANDNIYQIGQNNPEFKGMGTTGTVLALRAEGAWIGHVGDSRIYRIRDKEIQQLTFDHSWVWEMARRQGIDPDELGDFKKNIIIRSLGPEPVVDVDIEGPYPIEPGDIFLMCSDGLTNHVSPDELGAVASTFPPREACSFLIELANARGGSDNISCVIVKHPPLEPKSPINQKKSARSGELLKRLLQKLFLSPFVMLLSGAGLVALAIYLRVEHLSGAVLVFFFAVITTLIGLISLALDLNRKLHSKEAFHKSHQQQLNVYKRHQFVVNDELLKRFHDLEIGLEKLIRTSEVVVDWESYQEFQKLAENAPSALERFKARCQAIQTLAIPFNKMQRKSEEFKPNWKVR